MIRERDHKICPKHNVPISLAGNQEPKNPNLYYSSLKPNSFFKYFQVASFVGTSSPIRDGDTPLHFAAASKTNSEEMTKLLLQLGAKATVINIR